MMKKKLLKRDLIECKILNCRDNLKTCYCSQAGLWRVQGSCKVNEFSSAYLSGLIHNQPTGAWDIDKQEEGASVQQG